jgi:hypothetical protein
LGDGFVRCDVGKGFLIEEVDGVFGTLADECVLLFTSFLGFWFGSFVFGIRKFTVAAVENGVVCGLSGDCLMLDNDY